MQHENARHRVAAAVLRWDRLRVGDDNLKGELDAANQREHNFKAAWMRANTEIQKRQSEVERLSAELERATNLAKDAETSDQEEESASEPSDAWKPQ